jgi:hypothetical protein
MPAYPMTERDRARREAKARYVMRRPLQIACAWCQARPGELCRTKAGREVLNVSQMHNVRLSNKPRSIKYDYS